MKRSLSLTLIAAALILGLAWFLPHSFFKVNLETPTPQAEVVLPTPTEPQDIPITYQNISFTIPVGLADGAQAVSQPAEPGPLNSSPAYVEFKLTGYPFPDPNGIYQPRIRLYPASEYASVNLWAAESLNRLQSALVNPAVPLTNDVLPNVPYMGSSAQLYAAQVKELPFESGNGLRMISSYAQYPASIGRYSSFYHYEALTHDGKYFVVVEMPVNLPVWADESNPGEFGITYTRQEWLYMQSYYQSVTELLNQADAEGFNPMLGQLDRLVQSIRVADTPAAEVSPAPCLAPAAGTRLHIDSDNGYCLLYPARYSAQNPGFIIINPAPGFGDIPGDAWMLIQVEDAAGRTAEQALEAQMPAEMQGFNITRQSTTIDGEPAFIVDGLPGQDSNRKVFIVHNGRLYTLAFSPWQPTQLIGGMGQRTPLEYLSNIVIQSFRFLP